MSDVVLTKGLSIEKARIERLKEKLAEREAAYELALEQLIARQNRLLPRRNGVRIPKEGTIARMVWDYLDEYGVKELSELVKELPHVSRANLNQSLFQWKKARQ